MRSDLFNLVEGSCSCAYTVRDNVRVTVEAALGVAVRGLVARQVPDDQSLVARGRQEHVGAEHEAISILCLSMFFDF